MKSCCLLTYSQTSDNLCLPEGLELLQQAGQVEEQLLCAQEQ